MTQRLTVGMTHWQIIASKQRPRRRRRRPAPRGGIAFEAIPMVRRQTWADDLALLEPTRTPFPNAGPFGTAHNAAQFDADLAEADE